LSSGKYPHFEAYMFQNGDSLGKEVNDMRKEVIITPNELYYLGTLLRAEYIDYDYIAVMDDIEHDYDGFKSGCQASLSAKGILVESFTGDSNVAEDISALLNPIFFGKKEGSINDMSKENGTNVDVTKFHYLGDAITMVREKDRNLVVSEISLEDLKKYVSDLLDVGYDLEEKLIRDVISDEESTRIISFKCTSVESKSIVNIIAQVNGVFYYRNSEGKIESLSKQDFEQLGYSWIGGVA